MKQRSIPNPPPPPQFVFTIPLIFPLKFSPFFSLHFFPQFQDSVGRGRQGGKRPSNGEYSSVQGSPQLGQGQRLAKRLGIVVFQSSDYQETEDCCERRRGRRGGSMDERIRLFRQSQWGPFQFPNPNRCRLARLPHLLPKPKHPCLSGPLFPTPSMNIFLFLCTFVDGSDFLVSIMSLF